MGTPHPCPPARPRQSRGFALLITLTLVAFLVLIVVALASLTRVETRVAANGQSLAQARQNALMALNIALGQLQKNTGPDQRVTAPADVLPPASFAWSTTADPATARMTDSAGIEAYWTGSRNRHWTGAWSNGNQAPYDATQSPAAANPSPKLETWLVSGNEDSLTYLPTDVVSGLGATSTPLEQIKDAGDRAYRLLVASSAGVTAAADLDRAVVAPEVPITAGSVPGLAGPGTVGHYAWWVGDEGVKARANLIDAYAADTSADGMITRFASAQRPAIEAMTINNASAATGNADDDGLAPYYQSNLAGLAAILEPRQLGFLKPASTVYPVQLRQRLHDLTTVSRGVLSDTQHGGLKRDLSYILGQDSAADFRAALNAAYDGASAAPDSVYNTALSSVATPYATLPPLPSGADPTKPYDGPAGILSFSATWEQLWSYYNLGNPATATPAGVFNAAGEAVPRRQTSTEQGLVPLLIQGKLFYRLRIVGGAATPDAGGVEVNHTGEIWMDVIPMIVLANPYDAPLAAADYVYKCAGSQPVLRFGDEPNPSDPATAYPSDPPGMSTGSETNQSHNLPNCGTGSVQLVLHCTGMQPGEAQVFSIAADTSQNPTLAAAADGTPDLIEITSKNDTRRVILTNDYDPTPALTFNTGRTIPADKTYAALFSASAQITSSLFMAADYDPAFDPVTRDLHLVRYFTGQQFGGSLGGLSNFFLVDPVADGAQQGGGYLFAINEAATPVASGETEKKLPQQAPFYQVNYRALLSLPIGTAGAGPGEWARTYAKSGSSGGHGSAASAWLQANLMFKPGSTKRVRWGLVNRTDAFNPTLPPSSIGGAAAGDVGFENLLHDLPSPGHPPASPGQLEHFNLTGFVGRSASVALASAPNQVHGWQVNHPIANSYPQPRTPRDRVIWSDHNMGYHYDGSYLWNDVLWDRFYFSSYPASGAFDFATDKLVNARYRPFRDRADIPWDAPAGFRGDGNPGNGANSRAAAQNLLVDGAFNINSTSVEAWKAVFASLRNVPAGTETAPASGAGNPNLTAPFSRTPRPLGGAPGAAAGNTPEAWNGIRNLTQPEINDLAQEMVMQVRKRGPFLSMAEFVNRRLVAASADTLGLGLGGALQAALDRVVNLPANVASPFDTTSDTAPANNYLADQDYIMPTALDGFPGHLLQGDLLSALGPSLAARSDTFTIRTYGDVANPVTGDIEGRAWCEAVVQRTPDYVIPKSGPGGDDAVDAATDPTNATFGRRYTVVRFRWLGPDDI